MSARSLLRSAAWAALIGMVVLPAALTRASVPARAGDLPACAQTRGCLAVVVNPNLGRTLGGRVVVSNLTRLPVIAVLRPDGSLSYLPTVIGQSGPVTLSVQPVSYADTLATIEGRGSLVPSNATRLTVKLDGVPQYAVVPRLRLAFAARFAGQSILVGEGSFTQAPANARVAVAAGGTITVQPAGAAVAAPLPGFVLQLKVLGKWVTVSNGRIPSSAPARFAQVPGKTWTCKGPAGSCQSAG